MQHSVCQSPEAELLGKDLKDVPELVKEADPDDTESLVRLLTYTISDQKGKPPLSRYMQRARPLAKERSRRL